MNMTTSIDQSKHSCNVDCNIDEHDDLDLASVTCMYCGSSDPEHNEETLNMNCGQDHCLIYTGYLICVLNVHMKGGHKSY